MKRISNPHLLIQFRKFSEQQINKSRMYPFSPHTLICQSQSETMEQTKQQFMRIAFYTPTPVTPGAVQSGLMLNLSWFDHNTELVCKAVNPVGTEMSAPYRISVTCKLFMLLFCRIFRDLFTILLLF